MLTRVCRLQFPEFNMIRVFTQNGDHLAMHELAEAEALPENAIWIDLLEPTKSDDARVEALTKVAIPTREDMKEIEESSRFYVENGAHYMTTPLLHSVDTDHPGMQPVTFILCGKRLITVRYCRPKSFILFEKYAAKPGNSFVSGACDGFSVFLGILESVTDRAADILEGISARLEEESARLFRTNPKSSGLSTPAFRKAMRHLGLEGSLLSKLLEALAGLSRLLVYVSVLNASESKSRSKSSARIKSLERDARSLTDHVVFLQNKITFLLDTIIGLVSVEQNGIIKIFSVAAVGFMPPTLVASIYGMNFRHMPELEWTWGYPMAGALMVLSAILPLAFFRYKGWL
jgi:magnesium transporter